MGCTFPWLAIAPFALPMVFGIIAAIGFRLDPSISNGYPGHV